MEKFVHSINWNGRMENCNPLFFSLSKSQWEQSSDRRTSQFRFHILYWFEINTPQHTTLLFFLPCLLVILLHFFTHNAISWAKADVVHIHTTINLIVNLNVNDAFTNFYWFYREKKRISYKSLKHLRLSTRLSCYCCCARNALKIA